MFQALNVTICMYSIFSGLTCWLSLMSKIKFLSSLDRLPLKWFVSYSTSEQVIVLVRCGIDDAIITQILDVIFHLLFPIWKGVTTSYLKVQSFLNSLCMLIHFLTIRIMIVRQTNKHMDMHSRNFKQIWTRYIWFQLWAFILGIAAQG